MVGFFVFLRRSLRAAARPVVLEHLRPLSKLFQDAFEIVSTGQNSLVGTYGYLRPLFLSRLF